MLDSTNEVNRYAKRDLLYFMRLTDRCNCFSNNKHGKLLVLPDLIHSDLLAVVYLKEMNL